jgi:transcriptional regulator with XRE-family HTH domain
LSEPQSVPSVPSEEGPVFLQLGSTDAGPFAVDANLLATGRTCVIGASGSGKSYTVGVICEELSRSGVPFVLIDTEGEYEGLKEKHEVVRVGESERADLAWGGLDLEDLAKQAPDIAPLILDMSETDDPKGKVSLFLTALYREVSERRTPYLVIVEEADRFVPQSGYRLPIFGELARRGRKRGLGLMVCTQRPSLVDKNILSQCGNQLIGKLVIRNDLQAVSQFFPGNALPKQLTSLSPGVFYALGGLSPEPVRLRVRHRETRHGGGTPVISRRTVKPYAYALSAEGARGPPARTVAAGSSASSQPEGPLGLTASISATDVPLWVRREKRFVFFGRQEVITAVQLVYRELIDAAVRLRTGRIRRRYETKYVTLDGQNGRFADLLGGIEFSDGFNGFLGLGEREVQLLKELRNDRDVSQIDLASKTGVSRGSLRNLLHVLEKRRLVRTSQMGKAKVYRRMIELPTPDWRLMPLKLEGVDLRSARVAKAVVREDELRQVVRALWGESDLESATIFLYPLYRVELASKRRRRTIWVDGRTGRGVDI